MATQRKNSKSVLRYPNIVLLSWHDTGRHLGCYGHKTVATPHLDLLAEKSLRLTNAYACAPVCGPSRTGMLTGRYPNSNGMYGQCHEGWTLNDDEEHLAGRLRRMGYACCVAGFQHEARMVDVEGLGFDAAVANVPEEGRWFPPVPRASRVVEAGLEWMDRGDVGQPRYLQIGFWETHRPYLEPAIRPDDSLGVEVPDYITDTPTARNDFAELQGAIRAADAALGQLVAGLKHRGLWENTLFIFVTDHGLAVPRAKLTGYDPGLEIAMLCHWPKHIQPGTHSGLVSNVDLLPTLSDWMGLGRDPRWQGQSFAELPATEARKGIFACCYEGDLRILRTDRYKLIRNLSKLRQYRCPVDLDDAGHFVLQRERGCKPVSELELYDLVEDRLETVNLVDSPAHRGVLEELEAELLQWMRDSSDPALEGPMWAPRWKQFLKSIQSRAGSANQRAGHEFVD